jgi:hypothetical protein
LEQIENEMPFGIASFTIDERAPKFEYQWKFHTFKLDSEFMFFLLGLPDNRNWFFQFTTWNQTLLKYSHS